MSTPEDAHGTKKGHPDLTGVADRILEVPSESDRCPTGTASGGLGIPEVSATRQSCERNDLWRAMGEM
jgi:hypothetical protein